MQGPCYTFLKNFEKNFHKISFLKFIKTGICTPRYLQGTPGPLNGRNILI